ncbi:MAG: 2-C-methyl-D-erythritol 2,4-cyclodiphosphate synthase [Chloroflexi bacterium]|jgi:2-C-methyl-D-erythritol 2,4-cyclodiphosphate synthase|nr:2-C-methyl-D-erythritol 2,4-cyclodiphosphate synthase [Chloroflexota bacterium]
MRVGIGYDAHRLTTDRSLILGGVEIPFDKGLEGWSDADVVVHAVMDALLGAAALGDIGNHFPPNDPSFKDISSITLLNRVGGLLKRQGWRIGNIDATIIAERPLLRPFITQMKQNISRALSINESEVGIKATTNEGLGFTGRQEGIAAYAVALLEKA